jgi:hypothetical protein
MGLFSGRGAGFQNAADGGGFGWLDSQFNLNVIFM